nr:TonB-dependent receptor [uncultured Pedobacter sp.]
MKKIILLLLMAFNLAVAFAQNNFKAIIKSKTNNETLIGATAKLNGSTLGTSTNVDGLLELKNIPNGKHTLTFSCIGFKPSMHTFDFPQLSKDTIIILLAPYEAELDEIIVSSTRSRGSISDIPTRMEVLAAEELEEKANMKPGDIRMVLNETTGISTQQTSATSANASIRIQGLDGRYTQILKDGFPLYAGFSGGLSLLQTPPLDLKQVEIIKGSASTLYGGGAIAGLVNLISKTPTNERVLDFQLNGTSAGGFDINGFYSEKFKKVGLTIFASHNRNAAYDPSNVGLTAIPKFERYVFNPKLFFYINDKTSLNVGLNTGFENRIGGDIKYIKGEGDAIHSYFERNKTDRVSSQIAFEHRINPYVSFSAKNSVNYFIRNLSLPNYLFKGQQTSSFTEVAYDYNREKLEWIVGGNVWTDQFTETKQVNVTPRDYAQNTLGAFVQNNYSANKWLTLETGLRGDYVSDYGFNLLPRASALFKINPKFTSRIGGGFGYKAPTIFTEDAEQVQFKNVLPIDKNHTKTEKSVGGNLDFNYRTGLLDDKVSFSVNQLFFYTYLDKPLQLTADANGTLNFVNANGHLDTKGFETNAKIGYSNFKLFLGYTFTDTKEHFNNILSDFRLTPKHRVNSILFYEVEDSWKIGLEAYYYSKQKLSDGATGKAYWLTGFMIEKLWKRFSIYGNFENYTDTRQTKFDTIYTGTITNPTFRDIYAPLDGFVFNGGIKLRL